VINYYQTKNISFSSYNIGLVINDDKLLVHSFLSLKIKHYSNFLIIDFYSTEAIIALEIAKIKIKHLIDSFSIIESKILIYLYDGNVFNSINELSSIEILETCFYKPCNCFIYISCNNFNFIELRTFIDYIETNDAYYKYYFNQILETKEIL
jgi:hypothetical protein